MVTRVFIRIAIDVIKNLFGGDDDADDDADDENDEEGNDVGEEDDDQSAPANKRQKATVEELVSHRFNTNQRILSTSFQIQTSN